LITSRWGTGWTEFADRLPVAVFDRPESVALLRDRADRLGEPDADQIAAALGDLPLAVAQAAGFLQETAMPVGEYLGLLDGQLAELFSENIPASHPAGLVATVSAAAAQLVPQHPVAVDILQLAAFLSPEPIPLDLLAGYPGTLEETLADASANPIILRRALGVLGRYALAHIEEDGLQLHRLVQAVLREQLPPTARAVRRTQVQTLLAAAYPGHPGNPATWPRYCRLLPHLLAAELASSDNPTARTFFRQAGWYLYARGEYRAAAEHTIPLYQYWQTKLGPNHPDTLRAAGDLATYLSALRDFAAAHALAKDTLTRQRRVLGEDHPDTLVSASNLAAALTELRNTEAAKALTEDTFARQQRVLGEDHPHTLTTAHNLATALAALGDIETARTLLDDILARRRRVLGDCHPHTLATAHNLATALAALGDLEAARTLFDDILAGLQQGFDSERTPAAATTHHPAETEPADRALPADTESNP
jgi:hypothetical protein